MAQNIILIETSTALCSVALAENGKITAYRESSAPKAHASLTAVFIQEMLEEKGLTIADCDAVCVSKGPGSYTGLRIGVSTAKCLCYALDIPLLATHTLDAMARGFVQQHPERMAPDVLLMPMIDARRMEVYTAAYGPDLNRVADVAAQIIDGESFVQQTDRRKIVLFGSGADKFVELFAGNEAVTVITGFKNSAAHLVELADAAYRAEQFEDIAYFEPFYLKEFVATTPRA